MANAFHTTQAAMTASERGSNAAPVPSFSVHYRPLTPEQSRERIMSIAAALCEADATGKPWDVRLFADRLVEDVMAMRAGAE